MWMKRGCHQNGSLADGYRCRRWARAGRCAGRARRRGLAVGETVILMSPPCVIPIKTPNQGTGGGAIE